jgi:hypothetical protein
MTFAMWRIAGARRTSIAPNPAQGRSLGLREVPAMQLLAQTTTTTDTNNAAAGMAALLGGGTVLIFSLIFLVILVGIYYLIIKKTGYNPWMSLLILIPGLGGLIIVIMLAFTEWPVQREVRELRARAGGTGYGPGATAYAPGAYPPGPTAGGPITPA